MFVCICNAISDRKIQEAVAAGASSLTDLKNQLGVATCCGSCADLASSYLKASPAANTVTSVVSSITVKH
ncbi:(2Fe-2S)-binding protein [Kingella negevensis]|uniref:(2Fe-2S)-binding protein n=1 Tax=Kingella negevensis TaxID=1522312 RepID=UPI0025437AD0|nr:(2Fe-2S)-binding protein [Kingella negevensis]WII93949.1 (2Fe-2S)-binding protein [Kingella negevensis]